MIEQVIDLVSFVALAVAGGVSLAFLYLYWRLHRRTWKRMDSPWIYIVSVNVAIAWVAGTSLLIRLGLDSLILYGLRAAGLVAFAGAVSYQVYLLYDHS